jgi:hypothetical protein
MVRKLAKTYGQRYRIHGQTNSCRLLVEERPVPPIATQHAWACGRRVVDLSLPTILVVSRDGVWTNDRLIELFVFGGVGSPMAPSPDICVNVKFEDPSTCGEVRGALYLARSESRPRGRLDRWRIRGEVDTTGLSIRGLRVRIPSASLSRNSRKS